MSVLRVVRGLVALEWGLIFLAVASSFVDLSALPEGVREFVYEEDEKLPSTLSVLVGVVALAVHLTASAGLWRLAPWARPTYAVSTLALLLSSLFLGPSVLSPVSGVLDSASSYAGGALLAVLYLPSLVSAAPPPVPGASAAGASAARSGLRWLSGIVIALGAGFAMVGVLATLLIGALVVVLSGQEEVWEAAAAAKGKSDVECLSLALARPEDRWLPAWWHDSTFFSLCLADAAATEELCAGVPPSSVEGDAAWSSERCSGAASPSRCEDLSGTLQAHCDERRDR